MTTYTSNIAMVPESTIKELEVSQIRPDSETWELDDHARHISSLAVSTPASMLPTIAAEAVILPSFKDRMDRTGPPARTR